MARRDDVPSWSQMFWAVLFLTLFHLGISDFALGQSSNVSQGISVVSSASRSPFIVAPTFSVSGAPSSAAVGDLNGDGKPDLVITKSGSNNVTVMLGTGDGRFTAGMDYQAGIGPASVQIGDLNEDGRLDLVVTNRSTGTVNVLLGNGDGTFGKPTQYGAVNDAVNVVLGDFGGHGAVDLAVSGSSSQTIALLLNDGNGHFSKATPYFTGKQAQSLVVADINGDGHPDLVSANSDGTVSVLLSSGTGVFRSFHSFSVAGSSLSGIAAGDYNGDGKIDLAVTRVGANQVTLLFGRGDGSFQSGVAYTVGNNPISIMTVDVNSDGIPDLITTNEAGNTFSVLTGNGDGTFKPSLDFTAGNAPRSLAAGDFNGDGQIDLAILNYLDGTISVPLGNGDGTFRAARAYRAELERKAIAAGDLNNDGKPDIVVTNFCGNDFTCKSNGTVTVFLAEAGGAYRAAASYALGNGPVAAALADVNGDKKFDLIALNRTDKSYTIMLGNGDGSFGEPLTFSLGKSPLALVVGDFNKDGNADLAISSDCGLNSCTLPGEIDILLGRGDGSFAATSAITVGYSPSSLALGDLNGDGIPDLAIANACGEDSSCKAHGTASILSGDGKGRFIQSREIDIGNAPSSIAIDSLAGSSSVSLVVASRTDNRISVLQGDGKGGFKAPQTYTVGAAPSSLAIADFDGDGKKDVAVGNFQSSTVNVLFGNGDGTLQPATTYAVGTGPESLVAVKSAKATAASLVSANGNAGSVPMGTDITVLANLSPDVAGTTQPKIVLSANPNTGLTVNEQISIKADLTQSGSPTPTGNVSFSNTLNSVTTPIDGCDTMTLTAGIATCITSALPAGSDSITASYGGDSTYASANESLPLTVGQLTTITTLISSLSPSSLNKPVKFTATVTISGASAPTKLSSLVSFTDTDGTTPLTCNPPVASNPNGIFTCTTTTLAAGPHSIHASYTGDPNFVHSSDMISQTVLYPTTTTLSPVAGTSVVNQIVTFTATVTRSAGTAPLTGTVVFKDGSTVINCAPSTWTPSTGVATCGTATLTAAQSPHSITAIYSGDTSNDTSTSNTATQTVNPATATVVLSSTPSSSTVNDPVTFTANVTVPPGPITLAAPSTVTITENNLPLAGCSVTWNPTTGIASCTTTKLTAGNHTVVATLKGDLNFTGSGNTTQQVAQYQASMTLSSPASAPVNSNVTFMVTVSPDNKPVALSGTATITVTNNNTNVVSQICSAAVNPATGALSCSSASLPVAAYTVTATYTDQNYTAGKQTAPLTIGPATGSLTLTPPATPITINESVIFTAALNATAGAGATPAGTITITNSTTGNQICAKPVSSTVGYTITCSTQALVLNGNTITVTYSDANQSFTASPVSASVTVTAATATLALVSSSAPANASTVNDTVTFTATLAVPSGLVTPSGTITFALDGNNVSSTKLTGGATTASYATSILTAGSHQIVASYSGDSAFIAAHPSNGVTQTVSKAASSLTLASSLNPSIVAPSTINTGVTFTATVTPTTKPVALSGTVAFTDNGVPISCSAPLNPTTGIATCQTSFQVAGSHPITATYTDANYLTSTSTVTQTVQDYSLIGSQTMPIAVTQGATSTTDLFTPYVAAGQSSIIVTPVSLSGFAGTVMLTCTPAPLATTSGTTQPGATPPACALNGNTGSTTVMITAGAQTPIYLVVDATNATPGAYSVSVTGKDTTTGLLRVTNGFNVYVRAKTDPITLVSGAVTGNTTNADFVLPPNVGLTNLKCAFAAGLTLTGEVNPAGLSIGCTFNPNTVPASNGFQTATVAVTISTNGTTMAQVVDHTGIFVASLIGVPILSLLGLLRCSKSSKSTFFRFLGVLFIAAAMMQAIGCGGHFTRTTTNTGLTPPGSYSILIQGTGSDGLTYDSVIQVNVTR